MRDLLRRTHEPVIHRSRNGCVLQSDAWRLRLRSAAFVCSAIVVLTACQTVQTTSPGVVGVNREQHFLVSEEQVQAAAVINTHYASTAASESLVSTRTHPDPAARIDDIERFIPGVLPLYQAQLRNHPPDSSLAQRRATK